MLERVKNRIKRVLETSPAPSSLPLSLPPYGYFAQDSTWEEVKARCSGYDSQAIIDKVHKALIQVRNGTAVYERDSVLFDEIQYAWPLLSCILLAAQKIGRVRIIDFGGSLGSTYFQNKKFLDEIADVSWNVIEQKHFVQMGRRDIGGDRLQFFETIEDCLNEKEIDILLVSGALQYLPAPWTMLQNFLEKDFKFLIFDRTTFNKDPKDQMTKQIVPPVIYEASYPALFLNKEHFKKTISEKYRLLEEWEALGEKTPIYRPDGSHFLGHHSGFFYLKK